MRMLITVLLLAMVGLPASAKSKAKNFANAKAAQAPSKFTGDLLSYEALIKLPSAKRVEYMKDMVDLLATMESFNNKYTVAEQSRLRRFRDEVAQLMKMMSLLPEAQAEDGDEPGPLDVSKIIPAWVGNEWTCGRGAEFNYEMRACLVQNAAGQTNFTAANSSEEDALPCPRGTHEVAHPRAGSAACIPDANWALIPAERKSGIANKGFLAPRFLRQEPFEKQKELVLGPAPGPSLVAPTSRAGAAVVSGEPGDEAVGDSRPPGDVAIGDSRPPGDIATGDSRPAGAAGIGQSAPAQPGSCEPAAVACKKLNAGERGTAIGRFRATADYQGENANICIAGGFASKYKGTEKKPSSCDIRRDLTLAPGKSTKPCKADEALCNPVLFCVGGKNSAGNFEPVTFCVKKSGDRVNRPITDACASKYAQKLAQKIPLLDCEIDPKLPADKKRQAQANCDGSKKVKAVACDPAYLPADVQFKKLWQSLIVDTKKLRDVWCGKLDFAALFCRECEVVNDKIYSMNKSATGTGCPEVRAPARQAVPAPADAPASAVREQGTDDDRPDKR